jgi:hypothetical protein
MAKTNNIPKLISDITIFLSKGMTLHVIKLIIYVTIGAITKIIMLELKGILFL